MSEAVGIFISMLTERDLIDEPLQLMKFFDSNGDGELDVEELRRALTAINNDIPVTDQVSAARARAWRGAARSRPLLYAFVSPCLCVRRRIFPR